MPTSTPTHISARARRPLRRLIGVAALGIGVAALLGPSVAAAGQPVGLGTAHSFGVLAGAGITNTGATTITGDVGTFPTTDQSGFASVTLIGTDHAGGLVTQGAKPDLETAYLDAAGRTPVTNVPTELGGTTRLPGVYASPTLGLTGTLTLDAEGDPAATFVFQAESTLIAEANSRVLLLGGADPCRVVWQVGSSATFKTGASFVGDVLALTSITAQTTATFQGRLLARNGAVTLDTNTITRPLCTSGTDGGTTDGTDTTGGTDGGTDTTDGTDTTGGTGGGEGTDGTPEGVSGVGGGSGPPRSATATGEGSPGAPSSAGGTDRSALPRTGRGVLTTFGAGIGLVAFGAVLLVSRPPESIHLRRD